MKVDDECGSIRPHTTSYKALLVSCIFQAGSEGSEVAGDIRLQQA
jgi:hypothetical protein